MDDNASELPDGVGYDAIDEETARRVVAAVDLRSASPDPAALLAGLERLRSDYHFKLFLETTPSRKTYTTLIERLRRSAARFLIDLNGVLADDVVKSMLITPNSMFDQSDDNCGESDRAVFLDKELRESRANLQKILEAADISLNVIEKRSRRGANRRESRALRDQPAEIWLHLDGLPELFRQHFGPSYLIKHGKTSPASRFMEAVCRELGLPAR